MFTRKGLDTTAWNVDGSPGCLESMMYNCDGFGAESAILETDDLIDKSTRIVKFEIQLSFGTLIIRA